MTETPIEPWDAAEPEDILDTFRAMLHAVTGDGAAKRRSGSKPSWKVDPGHETAVFSHLWKWKNGEMADPDSGAHPLVHAAWRLLAIAWQESGGTVYTHKHHKAPSVPPAVITTDRPITAETAARIREEWLAASGGPLVVLDEGLGPGLMVQGVLEAVADRLGPDAAQAIALDAVSRARIAQGATEAPEGTETAPEAPEASWRPSHLRPGPGDDGWEVCPLGAGVERHPTTYDHINGTPRGFTDEEDGWATRPVSARRRRRAARREARRRGYEG